MPFLAKMINITIFIYKFVIYHYCTQNPLNSIKSPQITINN